jgi:hypothetical protein
VFAAMKINGELCESFDTKGDYKDIDIQLSFPGFFKEKDILLKINPKYLSSYTIHQHSFRIELIRNQDKWTSAQIYYFS